MKLTQERTKKRTRQQVTTQGRGRRVWLTDICIRSGWSQSTCLLRLFFLSALGSMGMTCSSSWNGIPRRVCPSMTRGGREGRGCRKVQPSSCTPFAMLSRLAMLKPHEVNRSQILDFLVRLVVVEVVWFWLWVNFICLRKSEGRTGIFPPSAMQAERYFPAYFYYLILYRVMLITDHLVPYSPPPILYDYQGSTPCSARYSQICNTVPTLRSWTSGVRNAESETPRITTLRTPMPS